MLGEELQRIVDGLLEEGLLIGEDGGDDIDELGPCKDIRWGP